MRNNRLGLLAALAVGMAIPRSLDSDRFLVPMPPSVRQKNRPRAHTVRTGAACARRAARKRRNVRARSPMARK